MKRRNFKKRFTRINMFSFDRYYRLDLRLQRALVRMDNGSDFRKIIRDNAVMNK